MRSSVISSALLLLGLCLSSSCAGTSSISAGNAPPNSALQLRVIEFGDHPDPHTGALRVIEANSHGWPQPLDALLAAVTDDWAPATVYDLRRLSLSPGTSVELNETAVHVNKIDQNEASITVKLDAAPNPIEITVPRNGTTIIGSEADGQRHAFAAVSLFDHSTSEQMKEVYSTKEPGITPPIRLSGKLPVAPPSVQASHQIGFLVNLEIDETGRVIRPRILGSPGLSPTERGDLEKAVSEWTFTPASRDGKPVGVVTTLPIAFE